MAWEVRISPVWEGPHWPHSFSPSVIQVKILSNPSPNPEMREEERKGRLRLRDLHSMEWWTTEHRGRQGGTCAEPITGPQEARGQEWDASREGWP
jgi:hypothetical protein